MNFYQYDGGPISRVDSYGRIPLRGDVRRLIPCPGGCGGQAELETPMTVTRDGVTCEVIPATCKGGCTVEIPPRGGRGRPKTIPQRFELDPNTLQREPEPIRKDEDMETKLEQERKRLRRCLKFSDMTQKRLAEHLVIHTSTIGNFLCKGYATDENLGKLMGWCDQAEKRVLADHRTGDNIPPESDVVAEVKHTAIVHQMPQNPSERKPRTLETANAYRAFLEPFLVSAVRDKLATIDPDLADTVEVRVLLEMPA